MVVSKLKAIWGYPDFKNDSGHWVRSWCTGSVYENNYTQHHTVSDGRWSDICKRSKLGGRYQKLKPTYVGVENKFKDFNYFVDWSQDQLGYPEKEDNGKFWSLDKDLIIPKNKFYSPETCLFVPNRVNCFFLTCAAARGEYPIGVSFSKLYGGYSASLQTKTGNTYLGRFDTSLEAHRAWQFAKISCGYELAEEFKHSNLKLYDAIIGNLSLIEKDYEFGKETIL